MPNRVHSYVLQVRVLTQSLSPGHERLCGILRIISMSSDNGTFLAFPERTLSRMQHDSKGVVSATYTEAPLTPHDLFSLLPLEILHRTSIASRRLTFLYIRN